MLNCSVFKSVSFVFILTTLIWANKPIFATGHSCTKVTFVQEWPVANGFWIPWILGISKGFYYDEGIDLNIVAPPTVADTMKFLGTGRADIAFTTIMDVIFAKEQGMPVISIGRYGARNNWGIFTLNGQLVTLTQLKDKLIGVYNDAWTEVQLSLMLKSVGMTLDDIKIVFTTDNTVPLLLQKRIDATTGITNAEGTEITVIGQQTPEFIPAIKYGAPDIPIFMFAGNQNWLENNPQLAKAFMRATTRSIKYAIEHPDEATSIFCTKYSRAYNKNFVKQQWHDTIQILGSPGNNQLRQNDNSWHDILKISSSLGIVKNVLPVNKYYTNSYLSQEQ